MAYRIAIKLHLKKEDEGDNAARQLLSRPEFAAKKDEITSHYEEKLNLLYTDDPTGHLVTKKNQINLGISHIELLKVIHAFHKTPIPENNVSRIKSPKGHYFVAGNNSNELKLIKYNKLLGSGSFGAVYQVVDIDSGTLQAIKESPVENYLDHTNEVHILRKINANGPKIGLQSMPTAVFNILTDDAEIKMGILGKQYSEADLKILNKRRANFINDFDIPSQNQIIDECRQLVMGLKSLVDLNILHLDIKSQNVLVNQQSWDQNEVVISDFGGAIDLDNVDKHALIMDAWQAAYTSTSTCFEDQIKAKEIKDKYAEAFQNKDMQLMDQLASENYALRQAQMIFQLGTVLHEAFTYEPPYPMQEVITEENVKLSYPDTKKGYRQIPPNSAPKAIRSIIAQMLDPDYTRRPNVTTVLAVFEGHR